MYLALAAAHDGPILELAAGTGRIALPLAVAGHDVTAVDNDPEMLARAGMAWAAAQPAAAGSLELVEHDLTTLDLGETRFGLVVLAFNALLLLDDSAAEQAALDVATRHLAPGGRAVIDIWLPSPEDLVMYDGRFTLDWLRRDEERDEWVSKTSSAHYSPATASAEVTVFFDAWQDGGSVRRLARHDQVRFIGASELLAMAARAGLAVDVLAGDYDLSEFTAASERLVLVGRSASG